MKKKQPVRKLEVRKTTLKDLAVRSRIQAGQPSVDHTWDCPSVDPNGPTSICTQHCDEVATIGCSWWTCGTHCHIVG